jgi:uracil-DNA glycosylase
MQALPELPQALAVVAVTHCPSAAQHPWQVEGPHGGAELQAGWRRTTSNTATDATNERMGREASQDSRRRHARFTGRYAARGMSLRSLVPPAWAPHLEEALAAPTFAELERFLDEEWTNAVVFPPRDELFAALALTPPDAVKVVLLGQDPYPTRGNANGLAFSVAPGAKVPASLKNLFLGLRADLGVEAPGHGDLSGWAERGVLLLNTVLTVREGEPQSHQKRGWEPFTRAVLEVVARRPGRIVFLCLGKPALKLAQSLATAHPIVAAPHPSPLNGRAFEETARDERLFTRVNGLLVEAGVAPVEWAL